MPAPALWHASYPECASVALLSERRKRSTAVMAAAEMSAVDTIGKTIRRAVVPPKTTQALIRRWSIRPKAVGGRDEPERRVPCR